MSNLPEEFDLAVAICTKDNIRTIGRALDSVRPLARRIVVVDSGSTDGTIELCRSRGAEVTHQDWLGMVKQRETALRLCDSHEWVLLLDSDESLEPDLAGAIRETLGQDDAEVAGYAVNRKVWFLGGWLNYMYQPEWRLRLVRPRLAHVGGTEPHDQVMVKGRTGRLKGILRHDSWADLDDLASRQIHYAKVAAEHSRRGGHAISMLINPIGALLKQLVIRRGFLDGRRGLIAACMSANFTLLKHAFIGARRLESSRRNES
jgi:glycosyltransferase involved in cell wall biosynthesis